MIEQSLDAALNSVINVVFGGVITLLITMYRQKKKENDALKALLRDRIIQAYNHYCDDKKWIPIYALESINACFRSYEALGENGVINGLMEQLNDLPNYEPHQKG